MSNTQKSNKRKADEMEDEGASSQLPEFIVDNLDNIIGEIKDGASSQLPELNRDNITALPNVIGKSAAEVADIVQMDFGKWKFWYYGKKEEEEIMKLVHASAIAAKKAKEVDSLAKYDAFRADCEAAVDSAAGNKKPDYHGQTILDFYQFKKTMKTLMPEFKDIVVNERPVPPNATLTPILRTIKTLAEETVGMSPALIAPDTLVAPRLYLMLDDFYENCGSPTGTDLLHFLNAEAEQDKKMIPLLAKHSFSETLAAAVSVVFDVDIKPGVDKKTPAVRSTSPMRKKRKITPQRKEMMAEKVVRTPPPKAKKEFDGGNTFKEYYDACAKWGDLWAKTSSDGKPFYKIRSYWDTFRSERAAWYKRNTGKIPIFKEGTFDEIVVGPTPEEKEKRWREKKEKKRKRREKNKQEQ